jgi:hypothetical protein
VVYFKLLFRRSPRESRKTIVSQDVVQLNKIQIWYILIKDKRVTGVPNCSVLKKCESCKCCKSSDSYSRASPAGTIYFSDIMSFVSF